MDCDSFTPALWSILFLRSFHNVSVINFCCFSGQRLVVGAFLFFNTYQIVVLARPSVCVMALIDFILFLEWLAISLWHVVILRLCQCNKACF